MCIRAKQSCFSNSCSLALDAKGGTNVVKSTTAWMQEVEQHKEQLSRKPENDQADTCFRHCITECFVRFRPDSRVTFSCAAKKKSPKRRPPEDSLEFTIPIPCASKIKQALASLLSAFPGLRSISTSCTSLGRCSTLFRPQTNACYNPVLISMLGIVSRE